jgi:hypothetical protein
MIKPLQAGWNLRPSLRETKQSSVPFPSGLLPVFWIASFLAMTNALFVIISGATKCCCRKPLAGFKTTARVTYEKIFLVFFLKKFGYLKKV